MDDLLKGCNDFIGKEKKFQMEICYIILFYMVAKNSLAICKSSNVIMNDKIEKNVQWWQNS
jgi:hypothetical protein